MSLQVDRRGLRVLAPRGVASSAIERFVRSHEHWILERLEAVRAARQARRKVIADGAVILLAGEPVQIRLAARRRGVSWQRASDGPRLLCLPADRPQAALERALRAHALAWFEPRVARACAQLGVAAPRVSLTSAQTRWGSCSLRSGIRLHWKLVLLPPELAEYVIAHEVAHLCEMNHSPAFWSVVACLCPDWRKLRRRLRDEGTTVPEFIAPDCRGQAPEEKP